MAMRLEANINILWQNLIALNASLIKENEQRGSELLTTKKLLEKVCIHENKYLYPSVRINMKKDAFKPKKI